VEIPVENLRDIRGVRLSLLSLLGFGLAADFLFCHGFTRIILKD